jgi:hypothetical protein
MHYWPSSKKTIEGTVAAFLGIMFAAVNFGIVCSRLESCAVDSTDLPFLQSKLMYWRAYGNLLLTSYFDSLYRFLRCCFRYCHISSLRVGGLNGTNR